MRTHFVRRYIRFSAVAAPALRSMPTSLRQISFAFAFILACAITADASPITFTFSGTIDLANAEPSGAFGTLTSGVAFSGSLTYESAAPAILSDTGSAAYNGVTAFSLTVGHETITAVPGGAIGTVDLGGGGWELHVAPGYSVNSNLEAVNVQNLGSIGGIPIIGEGVTMKFSAPSGVFSGTALPEVVKPGDFSEEMTLLLRGFDSVASQQVGVAAGITSFEVTMGHPVPEPATLTLLALGIAAGAVRRVRSSR